MAYTRYGQVLLDDLKRRMAFQNLSQHVSRVTLINGTEIVCQSIFGQDQVTITCIPRLPYKRRVVHNLDTYGFDRYLIVLEYPYLVRSFIFDTKDRSISEHNSHIKSGGTGYSHTANVYPYNSVKDMLFSRVNSNDISYSGSKTNLRHACSKYYVPEDEIADGASVALSKRCCLSNISFPIPGFGRYSFVVSAGGQYRYYDGNACLRIVDNSNQDLIFGGILRNHYGWSRSAENFFDSYSEYGVPGSGTSFSGQYYSIQLHKPDKATDDHGFIEIRRIGYFVDAEKYALLVTRFEGDANGELSRTAHSGTAYETEPALTELYTGDELFASHEMAFDPYTRSALSLQYSVTVVENSSSDSTTTEELGTETVIDGSFRDDYVFFRDTRIRNTCYHSISNSPSLGINSVMLNNSYTLQTRDYYTVTSYLWNGADWVYDTTWTSDYYNRKTHVNMYGGGKEIYRYIGATTDYTNDMFSLKAVMLKYHPPYDKICEYDELGGGGVDIYNWPDPLSRPDRYPAMWPPLYYSVVLDGLDREVLTDCSIDPDADYWHIYAWISLAVGDYSAMGFTKEFRDFKFWLKGPVPLLPQEIIPDIPKAIEEVESSESDSEIVFDPPRTITFADKKYGTFEDVTDEIVEKILAIDPSLSLTYISVQAVYLFKPGDLYGPI